MPVARVIPVLSDPQLDALNSRAEAKTYRGLRDQLPDRVLVLHRAEWIIRQPGQGASDGEADFLICDPDNGLLTLEIKGGGIRFDAATDSWASTDRDGCEHSIKDPFRQAKQAKYAVLAKLREHRRWLHCGVGKIVAGHAVLFPDIGKLDLFAQARIPPEILGGYSETAALGSWIQRVLNYWRSQDPGLARPGPKVAALVEEIFARPVTVRALVAAQLAEEEQKHIDLTNQQARILGFLAGHRRVGICGGAGTGKTLLAVEKAKRLADEGFRTLLVCYNRPLGDHLAKVCEGIRGLEVASFHSLCGHRVHLAKQASGRDLLAEAIAACPAGDRYDVQMPLALAYSVDVLKGGYDAIVVDEGQDFREEYWLPIELLLTDEKESPLYIFYDQNQTLYKRASTFPVSGEPYVLTANCRNTKAIHGLSYRYFEGESTSPPAIDGSPVVAIILLPALTAQASKIQTLVTTLLVDEQVSPAHIIVLVADAASKAAYYRALASLPLPLKLRWAPEDHQSPGVLLIETVNRFKGLESAITILWVGNDINPDTQREMLYVGTSRAKSLIYVVGTKAATNRVLADLES